MARIIVQTLNPSTGRISETVFPDITNTKVVIVNNDEEKSRSTLWLGDGIVEFEKERRKREG